jgi:hypothetical protein
MINLNKSSITTGKQESRKAGKQESRKAGKQEILPHPYVTIQTPQQKTPQTLRVLSPILHPALLLSPSVTSHFI